MKNKTIGIYLITERASRRDVYVGQSIGIEGRWPRHWKKFPQDRFDYRILLECPPCDLDFWEQHYIRVLKTHWTEGGENQDWGGQYWPRPEEPRSPASRAKQSAAMKGRPGRVQSEETKAKLSAALKGRVQSEEEKAKRSAAMKGKNKGRVAPNKGKPMSEEQKAKQSAAQKGRVQSEEHRAKLSAAKKGKTRSAESRAKQSATLKGRVSPNKGKPMSEEAKAKLKGRVMSEEQKMKLSESAKARAALKRAAEAAATVALEALLFTETETILSPE